MNTPRYESIHGAAQWLRELEAAGLLFHLDDDPRDIFGPGQLADDLRAGQTALWRDCRAAGIDPFDLLPTLADGSPNPQAQAITAALSRAGGKP